jgi:VanZ family protein
VNRRRGFMGAAWIAYMVVILYATTAPFQFTRDPQIVAMKIAHVSRNPLFDPWTGERVSTLGFCLNVLFFVPFGALGTGAVRPAGGVARWPSLAVSFLGCFVSVSVETLQVFTRNRIPSSADVLANTIGTIVGIVMAGWTWPDK